MVGVHTPEFPFERDVGQRRRRDRPERDRLPGRPGQRLRHLERLRQPVLAGQVPDRRRRRGLATRTSARATTTRPRQAIRSLLARGRRHRPRRRDRAPAPRRPDPDLTSPETYLGAARAQGWVNQPPAGQAELRQRPTRRIAQPQRVRLRRRLGDHRRGRHRRRGADRQPRDSRPAACSSSSAPRAARSRCRSSSTASRSPAADAGDDVRTDGARSPPSASTGWSTSEGRASTR